MNIIISGHTNSYYTYSLEDALEGIASTGYSYAELTSVPGRNEFVKASDNPSRVRNLLENAGLDCVAMSLHLEPDDKASVDGAAELVRWAGDFGLDHLNCALGDAPADSKNWIRNLDMLGSLASTNEVSFNLEVHGPLASTGRLLMEVLAEVGNPALGINYDTGNVEYHGGASMEEDLPAALGRVRHIHLKDKLGGQGDWAFPALGGGHVDFVALARLLKDGETTPPLSVELEFHGDPWPSLAVVTDAMAVSMKHLVKVGLA